jgi:hypothetical protein
MSDDFEGQRIPLGTVLRWISGTVAATLMVAGIWVHISERIESHEARIHNIEDHVVWRGQ